ncbi:MAG: two-component regulator propeller domain-containing protein [Limisphaerales bacterium]
MSPCAPLLCFALACLALARSSGHAVEPEFSLTKWHTDRGLPDNSVTSVLPARDGYIWLAGDSGLARFDGVRFRRLDPGPDTDMAAARMRLLHEDQQGRLWTALYYGQLAYFQQGKFHLPVQSRGPRRNVASFCTDENGDLFVGWNNGQVSAFRAGHLAPATGFPATDGAIQLCADRADKRVWFRQGSQWGWRDGTNSVVLAADLRVPTLLLPARAGGVWALSGNQLWRVTDTTEPVVTAPLPVSATNCTALLEGDDGALWLGTLWTGLFRLRAGRFDRVVESDKRINSLAQDREGNVWAGTQEDGLWRLRPRVLTVLGEAAGLAPQLVLSASICADQAGRLWALSEDHRLQPFENGRFTKGVALNSQLKCLHPAADGGLWVGTWGEGVWHFDTKVTRRWRLADGLPSENIRALLGDDRGRLWIGTEDGLALLADGRINATPFPSGPEHANIRSLALDATGALWLGTVDGRLVSLSRARRREFTRADGLTGREILCLLPAPDGALWLGTDGGGLSRLKGGRCQTLTLQHGLWDEAIAALHLGPGGRLWCGSNRGVFSVALAELDAVLDGRARRVHCSVPGRVDGLADFTCLARSQPSAWAAGDRWWVATSLGLVGVDLRAPVATARAFPVRVEEVLLDGKVVPTDGELLVPPHAGRIGMRFTALSFVAPELISFRYRVDDLQEDWIYHGPQRVAVVENLPPGRHTLRVQASNNDGEWSADGATLALLVQPHWWQTLWLRSLASALLALLAAWAWRAAATRKLRRQLAHLEREQAVERERARIARDLHDDVGARLTQLSYLSELGLRDTPLPDATEKKLRQVSECVHDAVRAMDQIVWEVNPGNDSLERLLEFMARHAREYLTPLDIRCRHELPAELPALKVSPEARHQLFLAFKEALQNIVKHARATEVNFTAAVRGEVLELNLRDNGQGGAPTTEAGADGLPNMKLRLEQLRGECRFESQPGSGARVEFRVPLAALRAKP